MGTSTCSLIINFVSAIRYKTTAVARGDFLTCTDGRYDIVCEGGLADDENAFSSRFAYAKAAVAGDVYAAKKVKFVTDSETGDRKPVEIATRVKPWWFTLRQGDSSTCLLLSRHHLEISVDLLFECKLLGD